MNAPATGFAPHVHTRRGPTLDEIINTAAEVWNVDAWHVTGRQGARRYSDPRVAAVTLAVEAGYSPRVIGETFDGRNYSFATLATIRTEFLEAEDEQFARNLHELRGYLADIAPLIGNPFDGPVSAHRLVASVARDFHISPLIVNSPSRRKKAAMARAVVYKLMHEDGVSATAIGRRFDRDHSTVLHSLKIFDKLMTHYPVVGVSYDRHCAMREAARPRRVAA